MGRHCPYDATGLGISRSTVAPSDSRIFSLQVIYSASERVKTTDRDHPVYTFEKRGPQQKRGRTHLFL